MSMATLGRAVLAGAKLAANNPRLKSKDIMEWSTSEKAVRVNARSDEVVLCVPDPGVWIAVHAAKVIGKAAL